MASFFVLKIIVNTLFFEKSGNKRKVAFSKLDAIFALFACNNVVEMYLSIVFLHDPRNDFEGVHVLIGFKI